VDAGSEGEDSRREHESGDKVSVVARQHGLTPQQLFGWRRDAQRRTVRRQGSAAVSRVTFAPVMVEAEASAPSSATSCAIPCGMIEIALGSAVVRVGPGSDVVTLTKVLRAVKAAT
jgi:transposase